MKNNNTPEHLTSVETPGLETEPGSGIGTREAPVLLIRSLFEEVRPRYQKGKQSATANIEVLMTRLESEPALHEGFKQAILNVIMHSSLHQAMLDSGIPVARGFWQEFSSRLKHKFLPPVQDPTDFLATINQIFYRKDDYEWVESIPRESWIRFFDMLNLSVRDSQQQFRVHLVGTLKILSLQVAQLGLEKEIFQSGTGLSPYTGCFIKQCDEVRSLELAMQSGIGEEELVQRCMDISILLQGVIGQMEQIKADQKDRGASLSQTYILLLLEHRIRRMLLLIDALDNNHEFDTGRLVDFFRVMVRNENRKYSLREFISQGAGLLAYQIAEQKGLKGTKYITSTWKEYFQMQKSAMWGGFIVSFVAVFKNLLAGIHMPPFWHGMSYSVNYAAGFIAIEDTGSTLATKQPAFTASTVAASMDTKKEGSLNFHNLAITVARVSRSQIASFFGNLVIVFPLTYLMAWAYHYLFGTRIAEGVAAYTLLNNQHPWKSLAILYACNTGVFLFLSGIIAGYVQNKVKYGRVSLRLLSHSLLVRTFSPRRLSRLASYVDKHAGSLAGNLALGFFLGMSAVATDILGIPFDIRHITISAANVAVGLYGIGVDHIDHGYLAMVFVGVLCVGFFNFLVSFSLAFYVAVKSRGIRLKDYPEFLRILWKYFRDNPADFFVPRKIKHPVQAD